MPADSHHKLGLVLDVLILRILHVLQMCDSHKRQSNSQRRIPCDTISRAPIFMRLPAPVLQTLYRLRPASSRSILPEVPIQRVPGLTKILER